MSTTVKVVHDHRALTRDATASTAPWGVAPAKAKTGSRPAARKKPQPEEQPFTEFVPKLLIPAMAQACAAHGGPAPTLQWREGPMPVVGGQCWQIQGELPGPRRFWLCFETPDINSRKTFALAGVRAGRLPAGAVSHRREAHVPGPTGGALGAAPQRAEVAGAPTEPPTSPRLHLIGARLAL